MLYLSIYLSICYKWVRFIRVSLYINVIFGLRKEKKNEEKENEREKEKEKK